MASSLYRELTPEKLWSDSGCIEYLILSPARLPEDPFHITHLVHTKACGRAVRRVEWVNRHFLTEAQNQMLPYSSSRKSGFTGAHPRTEKR